jgi:hypothetical protein
MPAELKPLAEQARRERAAKTSEPEEFSAWRCTECGTGITSFRPNFSPRQCKGLIGYGANKGLVCTSVTFTLLYRGNAILHEEEAHERMPAQSQRSNELKRVSNA